MAASSRFRSASDLLWRLWQEERRVASLPEAIRPVTREEGYAVQALLERRSAGPLFGWKIAATSRAGQAHIGVDGPLAGRLLRERVLESGGTFRLGANHMRVAEPEFAFRMAHDIAPRAAPYEAPDVLAAIGSLHPAIEIPDSRYEDFTAVGAPQLIADNACAHLFVLGAATAADWRSMDLAAHRVTAAVSGPKTGTTHEGRGDNVLGGPLIALTWLVNELSGLGIPLERGQVVTTGTCAVPLPLSAGVAVSADFGQLGRVTCDVT
jgi:2-keto-4-pentenoate hydratase